MLVNRSELLAKVCITLAVFLFVVSSAFAQDIDTRKIEDHLFQLCSDEFGGRGSGEIGEFKAAEYIARVFNEIGLDTVSGYPDRLQRFEFTMRTLASFNAAPKRNLSDTLISQNVLGMLRGSDTSLANEFVVVGAHYDALGHGIWSHRIIRGEKDIFRGADHNASGIAGMLEIARVLKSNQHQLKRSVLFVAFGAGEAQSAGVPVLFGDRMIEENRMQAFIELNAIGRYRDTLFVAGYHSSPWFGNIAGELQSAVDGEIQLIDAPEHSGSVLFSHVRIPHLLFSTSEDRHTHGLHDKPNLIDVNSMRRICLAAVEIVRRLMDTERLIDFSVQPLKNTGSDDRYLWKGM